MLSTYANRHKKRKSLLNKGTPSLFSSSAFTMVELLSALAIIAIILAVAIPAIGNYIKAAKSTSQKQTLTVLNDALTRYKTQGGNVRGLTLGKPISKVLTLLQTPVTWANHSHKFLNAGTTYPTRSLEAVGEYQYYRFFRYGEYIGETVAANTPTSSNLAHGADTGYLACSSEQDGNFTARSTTQCIAYQINNGPITIIEGYSAYITLLAGESLKFWSCASAVDSTKSGSITYLSVSSSIAQLDTDGLSGLEYLYCYNNTHIKTLDLSHNTALKALETNSSSPTALQNLNIDNCTQLATLYIQNSQVSSLDLSNKPALRQLNITATKIATIDLSNKSQLYFFSAEDTANLNSVDFSECPALQQVYLNNSNISSLTLGTLPSLTLLRCSNTKITSLDISGAPALAITNFSNNSQLKSFNAGGNTNIINLDLGDSQLSSLNVTNCTSLDYLAVPNANLSTVDLTGLSNLSVLSISGNNLTSLDVSNAPSLIFLIVDCEDIGIPSIASFGGTLYVNANIASYSACGYLSSRQLTVDSSGNNLTTTNNILNSLPSTSYSSEIVMSSSLNTSDSAHIAAVAAAEANGWTTSYW